MGSNESQSGSTPLDGRQRLDIYRAGMGGMNEVGRDIQFGSNYQAPEYHGLSNGDYQQLQNDLTAGYTAPIDRAKTVDLQANDQAMADRGIYTSLNAIRANNDVNERYIPQYAAAGAAATDKRYQLEAGDMAARNAFNTEQAKQNYESTWRPWDYRAGIWNGTGGVSSSSNSGGWSI